ncbi:MAG: hypothetical protein GY733_06605 [bacterium]|nr:hypothetical protein [bacterium]
MAVAKKKKKNSPKQESAAETLDELQSRGDDLSVWIGENPGPVLAAAGAILALAAVYAFASSGVDSGKLDASTAIAHAKSEYREAMGGSYSGSFEVPEPANPEAARSTREEYIERFKELAKEHVGSEMGSYALVQVGSLQAQLDDVDGALESFRAALEPYEKNEAMRGVVLERIALLHERKGELEAAATAHLEASEVTGYPLRYFALLNAARTQAESGQSEIAIANFDRITSEAPDLLIPDHTQSMLLELKAKLSR